MDAIVEIDLKRVYNAVKHLEHIRAITSVPLIATNFDIKGKFVEIAELCLEELREV